MSDRDCRDCEHYKLIIKPYTQFYACTKWDCEFEKKKEVKKMYNSEKATMHMMRRYEEKLKEYMGDEYPVFAKEVAKEAFRYEVEDMAESEFKDFILDNFDFITR